MRDSDANIFLYTGEIGALQQAPVGIPLPLKTQVHVQGSGFTQVIRAHVQSYRGSRQAGKIRLHVCLCLKMAMDGVPWYQQGHLHYPLTFQKELDGSQGGSGGASMDPGKGCGLTPLCGHFCSLVLCSSNAEDMVQPCAGSW